MITLSDNDYKKIKTFLRKYRYIKSWVYDKQEGLFRAYKKSGEFFEISVEEDTSLEMILNKLDSVLMEPSLEKIGYTSRKMVKPGKITGIKKLYRLLVNLLTGK